MERLEAFGVATLRQLTRYIDLYLEAEQFSKRRYAGPARAVRVTHVAALLREADVTGDIELLAETLLGYLDAAFINHLRGGRGFSAERLEAGWVEFVSRVTRR